MQKYIKPVSKLYTIEFEGIVAASDLNINNRMGEDQLSLRKSGWSSDDWTDNDSYEEY